MKLSLLKLGIMGIYCIFALLFLGIGILFRGFHNWKRHTGIILICATGFSLLGVLVIFSLFMIPEYKELLPENFLSLFSDYVSGFICMAILGTAGIFLILISKKNAQHYAASDGDSNDPPSQPVN